MRRKAFGMDWDERQHPKRGWWWFSQPGVIWLRHKAPMWWDWLDYVPLAGYGFRKRQ